jgi:hypothetical protein
VPPREGCRFPLNLRAPPGTASWPKLNGDDPPPSLHEHYNYTRFIATTRQFVPLQRIGTFGLAVGAACAFSLGIARQVLTFHTTAWSSFALPTRRMPLGPSQGISQADPGGKRWHARAFDRESEQFRDFVLGRLSKVKIADEAGSATRDDADWRSFVSLIIAPHPGLTPAQSRAIAIAMRFVAGLPRSRCGVPSCSMRLNDSALTSRQTYGPQPSST